MNFVSYATPLWQIVFICLAFFQDIKGAKACVTFAQGNQLYIAGQPSFFNYSTSQKIQRPELVWLTFCVPMSSSFWFYTIHLGWSIVHNEPFSDFIWPILRPFMGVIPNLKIAFIFPISCIFRTYFPNFIKYFPKCERKGSFLKSQLKSLGVTGYNLFLFYSFL